MPRVIDKERGLDDLDEGGRMMHRVVVTSFVAGLVAVLGLPLIHVLKFVFR